MDAAERKRLEEKGFRVGTVAEFLGLSEAESELIEIKLSLTYALRKQRQQSNLSQAELAEQIGSSQSRIAKMETGNPHVSLDLMIRALLALGMTREGLSEVLSPQPNTTSPSQPPRAASNGSSKKDATKKAATRPPRVPEGAAV